MDFKRLAQKAQTFATSPQGRKMVRRATDAVDQRRGGHSSGTGRASGLDRVLDAARRFSDGGRGQTGDPGRDGGPRPPQH